MTITIDATYEDGVLKPEHPLALREHEKVRVTVESQLAADHPNGADVVECANGKPSLAEKILALGRAIPDEVVNSWPTDGASQHDHYIYGTPKRPE